MVARIVPAAEHLVGHGRVSLPLDSVPLRERTCLLSLIEEQRFVERVCVILLGGGKYAGRSSGSSECRARCGYSR